VWRPLRRPGRLVEHHQVTLTVDVGVEAPPLSEVAGSLSSEDAQELREIIDRECPEVVHGVGRIRDLVAVGVNGVLGELQAKPLVETVSQRVLDLGAVPVGLSRGLCDVNYSVRRIRCAD
jgi:hypothetical protein